MIPRQGTAERQYYDNLAAPTETTITAEAKIPAELMTHLPPGWLESYVQVEMQRRFKEQLQEMINEMIQGKSK